MIVSQKHQRYTMKLNHQTLSSYVLLLFVFTNIILPFLVKEASTQLPALDEKGKSSIPITYLDPIEVEDHRLATIRRMNQDYCVFIWYDKKQKGRIPIIVDSKLSTRDGWQHGSQVNNNDDDHHNTSRRLSSDTTFQNTTNNKKQNRPQIINDPNKKMTFLHIGKTSGTTIARGLKKAYFDNDYFQGEFPRFKATKLSIMVRQIVHTSTFFDFLDEEEHKYSRFLISVRHPVRRIQSWFDYENHFEDSNIYCGKAMLYSCYKRFDQLATVGLHGSRPHPLVYKVGGNLSQEECSHWAWGTVQGDASAKSHNYMNYERYTSTIFNMEEREIFVIRQEHTWDDWRTIDLMIGGTGVLPFEEGKEKKSNVNRHHDKGITEEGLANACRALCDEIQIYKRLLVEAMNLNHMDRQQSLEELRQVCPLEASLSARVCTYN